MAFQAAKVFMIIHDTICRLDCREDFVLLVFGWRSRVLEGPNVFLPAVLPHNINPVIPCACDLQVLNLIAALH